MEMLVAAPHRHRLVVGVHEHHAPGGPPVAPPSQRPSATRARGRRWVATIWASGPAASPAACARSGPISRAYSPAADAPRLPVTATASPGRACDLSRAAPGWTPSRVTFTIQPLGEAEVSPPTTVTPWGAAASPMPA